MTEFTIATTPQAFGDGSHPTTLGVLTALNTLDPDQFSPRLACDIGAGSGILAFSIINKFSCSTIATDIEQQSIEIMRSNAKNNGIAILPYLQDHFVKEINSSAQFTPWLLPLQASGFDHPAIAQAATFDLITMNILAEPLLGLAADAHRHLAPEGVLIVSGILQWQEATLRAAYQGLGLELTSRLVIGDWVTLVWQKP